MSAPTEPKPMGTGDHVCFDCGRHQTPDQARWGHAVPGLVFPAWFTWLCAFCDAPWYLEVHMVDPNEEYRRRRLEPQENEKPDRDEMIAALGEEMPPWSGGGGW